ncbi:MAG: hypothetical protein RSE62_03275 [Citrobacter sp.]
MALSRRQWQEGYDAFHAGKLRRRNPYHPLREVDQHSEWNDGWCNASVESLGWDIET